MTVVLMTIVLDDGGNPMGIDEEVRRDALVDQDVHPLTSMHVGDHVLGGKHARTLLLTIVASILGVTAIIAGAVTSLHALGVVTGAGGVITGLTAQMVSENTNQRIFDVIATVLAGVGFGLSMAHGGF